MASFLTGFGTPTTQGSAGDVYLDTVNARLYYPKTTTWNGYITLGATASVIDSKAATQRISFRKDSASNWANENPILALGEPGYSVDENVLKIGNGIDDWVHRPALAGVAGSGTDSNGYVASGYVDAGYVS